MTLKGVFCFKVIFYSTITVSSDMAVCSALKRRKIKKSSAIYVGHHQLFKNQFVSIDDH